MSGTSAPAVTTIEGVAEALEKYQEGLEGNAPRINRAASCALNAKVWLTREYGPDFSRLSEEWRRKFLALLEPIMAALVPYGSMPNRVVETTVTALDGATVRGPLQYTDDPERLEWAFPGYFVGIEVLVMALKASLEPAASTE